MPVRFTSPGLGGQRESFFGKGDWQAGIYFRHLYANRWFVGSAAQESKAPFGKPLYLDINSVDLNVTYGLTGRTSLGLTLPFSRGTHSRFYADGVRHKVVASGLGDMSVLANTWLLDPWRYPDRNLALGLGVKAPTGSHRAEDDFFLADGSVTRRFVDQSIQPGDGGWGLLLQGQAFQRVTGSLTAYVSGAYLVSLRDTTDVAGPIPGAPSVPLAVPDVYSGRLGLAMAIAPDAGISASLGGRIDGIPQGDIVGGRDRGFRRPGYTIYADPGLSLQRARADFTVSLPFRVHQYFSRSDIDRERNFAGGGDLANYLLFISITRRF